jgi:hypothetical protein
MQLVTNNLCSTQILTRLRRSKRPEYNFFIITQISVILAASLILASLSSHCRGSLATFWRPTQFKIYGYFHRPKIILIMTNDKKIWKLWKSNYISCWIFIFCWNIFRIHYAVVNGSHHLQLVTKRRRRTDFCLFEGWGRQKYSFPSPRVSLGGTRSFLSKNLPEHCMANQGVWI